MYFKVAPDLPISETDIRAVVKIDDVPWLPKLEGVSLNRLSVLWPYSMLRQKLFEGAKRFIEGLKLEGFEWSRGEVLAYGPYPGRPFPDSDEPVMKHRFSEEWGKDYLLVTKFTREDIPTEIWAKEEYDG